MDRKDVTPKKQRNSGFKKFGIGLLGGLIGGALAIGVFYYATGMNTTDRTSTIGNTDSQGNVQVSNVKYDVDSDVTSAVEKVQDSVVSIINLQNVSQNDPFGGLFGTDQNEGTNDSDSSLEAASEGSGVIYKKEGDTAYIVTNNHVVEDQQGLEVLLADGTKEEATLVGTDAYTDLAVLKISSEKVSSVAEFGDSDALKVGEPAIAIGSPLGSDYANSVTQGIISSLNRLVESTNESGESVSINAIQTDAAINPGNSGGPLINIAGQVVGINSSKIASSGSNGVSVEGMGFAIPSKDVTTIINQLETDGKVTRPALGITMANLSSISAEQIKQFLKTPDSLTSGVVITSVNNATPAEQAGLKQYDVITEIDGEAIEDITDLRADLYQKKVGDTMEVTYYRGEDKDTTTVTLSVDQSILNQ